MARLFCIPAHPNLIKAAADGITSTVAERKPSRFIVIGIELRGLRCGASVAATDRVATRIALGLRAITGGGALFIIGQERRGVEARPQRLALG